jgi:GNAT superfamily N-acetyltransferase
MLTGSAARATKAKSLATRPDSWSFGGPPVREEQDDQPEAEDQRQADGVPADHRDLAQRQPAVMHAIIEHRVQPADQHGKEARRRAEQEPALRVAGLTPGHQHPHQTAARARRRGGTVAGELEVAGEGGQQDPGGYEHQAERAEDRGRRRGQPEVALGDRSCPKCLAARWLRLRHGAHATPGSFGNVTAEHCTPRPGRSLRRVYSAYMDHAEVVPELAVPADVPSLVVTCADAFSDDAMIHWPMPEATPAMLQELFRVILEPYVEFGALWKISGCDGGAAWLPPGVAGRFDEIEQSARAAINPLTDDGGVRYATFWDWLGAHLPAQPSWFLDLVAVAPAAQGRGLGRRLVMHGLDLARADGCPAFLETGTPRNVPFYQSLGFQIVDEQRAPDGGPLIWFMQTPRLPGQVPQILGTEASRLGAGITPVQNLFSEVRAESGGRGIRTHGDVAATMVFKTVRDSPSATVSTWTSSVPACYVIQDHPAHIP